MTNLEQELYRLKKVEPSSKFCQEAKSRLMHKIVFDSNEKWFLSLFKKVFRVNPPSHFVQIARMRLLERIEVIKRPVRSWFLFLKRAVATTLVMMIAVTSTLFFVDGKQRVSASENTYLVVQGGEVTVKHADRLIWDVVSEQVELAAGDLIRLGDSASATIHFFDDSQMRLAENSSLLLSRMTVSPGYARQGIIEVSLHQGKVWVQTLNADDDYANFTLITPDAIVSTYNSSFDVQTGWLEPTTIRTFKHGVNVRALVRDTRNIFTSGRLNSYQQITLEAANSSRNSMELASFAPITDLTEEAREDVWVVDNLESDRNHLTKLREREIVTLRATTGVLPGQVLYPVKRAKERLKLAFTFKNESTANAQIIIANERLNEAIVLIEQGDAEAAKLSLMEYQKLVRQIAESEKDEEADLGQLSNRIVTAHQKTLVAALPGDAQIGIVKQVLNQTEELLAGDQIELATIRLQNDLEGLVHVQDLVEAGDLDGAKEALINHTILTTSLLEDAENLEDEEQKKVLFSQILEAQYEEQRILSELGKNLVKSDSPLIALVENAHQSITEEIKHTAAVVQPFLPDVILSQSVILPEDEKVMEFVDKVNIYSTAQGQSNQIKRLLSKHPQYQQNQEFLVKVRDRLDVRAKDQINVYLLELRREAVVAKSKVVKRKIDRARKDWENRN